MREDPEYIRQLVKKKGLASTNYAYSKETTERETRERTAERYTWEQKGIEAAKTSGKQYHVPLSKHLHMDIPGMQSFWATGLTLGFLPIIVTAPRMMAEKIAKKKE